MLLAKIKQSIAGFLKSYLLLFFLLLSGALIYWQTLKLKQTPEKPNVDLNQVHVQLYQIKSLKFISQNKSTYQIHAENATQYSDDRNIILDNLRLESIKNIKNIENIENINNNLSNNLQMLNLQAPKALLNKDLSEMNFANGGDIQLQKPDQSIQIKGQNIQFLLREDVLNIKGLEANFNNPKSTSNHTIFAKKASWSQQNQTLEAQDIKITFAPKL